MKETDLSLSIWLVAIYMLLVLFIILIFSMGDDLLQEKPPLIVKISAYLLVFPAALTGFIYILTNKLNINFIVCEYTYFNCVSNSKFLSMFIDAKRATTISVIFSISAFSTVVFSLIRIIVNCFYIDSYNGWYFYKTSESNYPLKKAIIGSIVMIITLYIMSKFDNLTHIDIALSALKNGYVNSVMFIFIIWFLLSICAIVDIANILLWYAIRR